MREVTGWFLDVYAGDVGVVVWLAGEDGGRYRLTQAFPVTFYATGPFDRLRQLWRHLRQSRPAPRLGRARRADLFAGPLDVMEICAFGPARQQQLFREAQANFPDLEYYDADIPLGLRYAARFGVTPLLRCRVWAGETGEIAAIAPLDTRWDLDAEAPPLRVMTITPDVDPARREPAGLRLAAGGKAWTLTLAPARSLLISLRAALRRHDPDVVLTRWGDTWLFPRLLALQTELGAGYFNLNRDESRQPLRRAANSYFTYGQVLHRGEQVHLFGRWHIDECNAMLFKEYGLEGVFEQARVTGLPVQEMARKSPGAGITTMQMRVALEREILVPHQKQQTERFKSALDLIRSDRGGLVYQPLVGLHHDVAEIDFVSMYPSIMVKFNVSPETMGTGGERAKIVPELGLPIDQSREGLVPATLRPLLAKRLAIKQRMAAMHPLDCRYQSLKARSAALKWLLVVCFGYLGYKNARFGRIEGHEAVTAYSREMLLRAKEAAEDAGYTVLHMYVDGLWVKHDEGSAAGIQGVLEEIMARTGLPIALEGIHRRIAFLPSQLDERVPVANRYYGIFEDGTLKVRGIEARRHDTPPWIAQAQLDILRLLAAAPAEQLPNKFLGDVAAMLRARLAEIEGGRVAADQLLVTQRVSRVAEAYKVASPAARAMRQLAAEGKELRPGQYVRFLYTRGEPGVYAWNLAAPPDLRTIDTHRYGELLLRAAGSVLQPLIDEAALRDRVLGARQLSLW
jgi:DNA polymerase-2